MPSVKCLGWLNYFAPLADEGIADFYEKTLQLPLIRRFRGTDHPVDFFWGGEAMICEIIFEGTKGGAEPWESDPKTAPLMGVYRVHDLPAVIADLRSRGATVSEITRIEHGQEAFITDPRGYLHGLREMDESSPQPNDVLARRRWKRGEAFNPGCNPMPERWQEFGWLVRRVKDVAAMTDYYSKVVGLPVIGQRDGATLLDMGDGGTLELAPGGRVAPLPKNRAELPFVFIFRCKDVAGMKLHLAANGGTIVHELIQWDRGALSYVADPENNLIGIEEKYHPSKYLSGPASGAFSEDLECERRWIEHQFEAREKA